MNNTKISRRSFLAAAGIAGPDRLRLLRFQHGIFRGRLCRCFF